METLLPLLYSEGVARGRLTLPRLVAALCEEPARLFGLGHRKGRLAPGYDADVVVLDPNARWTIDGAALHSAAGWSPYDGRPVQGRVTHTLVRGRVAFEDGKVVGKAGLGEFVPPGR